MGGDGLEKRLAEFSARSMGVAGAGLNEAAHNIQVSASNDKFQIQLELPGFAPEDFGLKTKDDIIIVEAVHETQNEGGSTDSRRFTKEFKMPGGVVAEQLSSTYSGAGILTVSAPRVISAPEGAQVSEAMKAQSQAFVTDDGCNHSVRRWINHFKHEVFFFLIIIFNNDVLRWTHARGHVNGRNARHDVHGRRHGWYAFPWHG